MTLEERERIISNDYADLIVDYNRNERVFEQFTDATVQIMNDRFAVVYVPASQLNSQFISRNSYSILPLCYGLMSERALEASGVERLRRLPTFNLRGEGVLISVIDTGIDYMNPIFRKEDGSSKVVTIWDQTIFSENQYPENFNYGTIYTQAQINEALNSEAPLEIVPSVDEIGHGTMLAGVAAGAEVPESDFSGVAPDSELIIIKLKQAKQNLRDFFVIPADVPCYQENDIMWATQFSIQEARRLGRPLVICLGLGSSQGPHDGRVSLSSFLSVGGDFPGITIVTAMGNEGNTRRHFYDTVDADIGYSTVELNVGEEEPGFSMELWGTAPNTYSIDILSPAGEYIPRIVESLRLNREISFVFEETTISVDYQMVEEQTGDQLILMRFRNPTPGIWRFQVYTRGDLTGEFHIWLPINDFITTNTYFIQPDPYVTVTSPGTAIVPITVTAYNPENNNLFQRASRGFTRAQFVKPEVAAPGVNILVPDLDQGFAPASGTGIATAHTTGIAALLLEWGIVRGFYPGIDTVEVKKFLIRGARRNELFQYPNRDWGYGIVDIYNVFNILRAELQRI